MAGTDFSVEIPELERALASIEAVLDPAGKRVEIAALQEQVSAPDLWDDVDKAQQVTSRLSHTQSELDRLEAMGSRIEDLDALVEMAGEADAEGDAGGPAAKLSGGGLKQGVQGHGSGFQ